MAEQVRELLTAHQDRVSHGRSDLVFGGERGEYLDGSALRRRYKKALERARLRPLRFHDLRHTFGSIAINQATIVQVQAWMGHADVQTTMSTCTTAAAPATPNYSPPPFVPRRSGPLMARPK
jgi:integrase